jgi:energy-coupling factor transporter ATP-binding protein EcfA2
MSESSPMSLHQAESSIHTHKSDRIIGREKHVTESVYKLLTSRFVALVGEAGSGKSTLLHEGIVKALTGQLDPQFFRLSQERSRSWYVATMRPGHNPMLQLATALTSMDYYASDSDPSSKKVKRNSDPPNAIIENYFEGQYAGLLNYYKDRLENKNLLIIIDQLEDIFRFRHLMDDDKKSEVVDFIHNIVHVINKEGVGIYLAVAVQSEHLGQLAGIQGLGQIVNHGQYFIPPLKFDAIQKVYEQELTKTFNKGYAILNSSDSQSQVNTYKGSYRTYIQDVLEALNIYHKQSSFKDSNLLYLSKYALSYTSQVWLGEIEDVVERGNIEAQKFQKPTFDQLLNSFVESYKAFSKAPAMTQFNISTSNNVSRLNNYIEHHLSDLYEKWGYKIDVNNIGQDNISKFLQVEMSLAAYDIDNKWHVDNTMAAQIVNKSARILKILNPEANPIEVTSALLVEDDSLIKEVGSTIKELALLGNPVNVKSPEVFKDLKDKLDDNIAKIGNAFSNLAAKADRKAIDDMNEDLATQIISLQQHYFITVLKALTAKKRSGEDVRHPVLLEGLLKSGPMPKLSAEEKKHTSSEYVKNIIKCEEIYKDTVDEILNDLKAERLLDTIAYTPSGSNLPKHKDKFSIKAADILDVSTDAYINVSKGILQKWILDEIASSGIYLQLVRSSEKYYREVNRSPDNSFSENPVSQYKSSDLLLSTSNLGLTLDWRKQQIPSEGWAQRYDRELIELTQPTLDDESRMKSSKTYSSIYLEKALDYLKLSEEVAIQKEKDEINEELRRTQKWKRISRFIALLFLGAVGLSIYATIMRWNANYRLFEVNALNMIDYLTISGFVDVDSAYIYKREFDDRNEGGFFASRKYKKRKQPDMLKEYLFEKNIIEKPKENTHTQRALDALVAIYINNEQNVFNNEAYKDMFAVLDTIKDFRIILDEEQEKHNIIYHTLYRCYLSNREKFETSISKVEHQTSIFSMGSSGEYRSLFAIGDDNGEINLINKQEHSLRIVKNNIDWESEEISAIHFIDSLLIYGNDAGEVFIYRFDTEKGQLGKIIRKIGETEIPDKDQPGRPRIEQISAFKWIRAGSEDIYIVYRASDYLYLSKLEEGSIPSKVLGNRKGNIKGCGTLYDQLVLIDQSGISFWGLDEVTQPGKNGPLFGDNRGTLPDFSFSSLGNMGDAKLEGVFSTEINTVSSMIAIADNEGKLFLAKIDSTKQIDLRLFREAPHKLRINDLSFHPDGEQLASVSIDGTAKVYFNLSHSFEEEASDHLHLNADLKLRDNGSPKYYVVYNNDEDLITTTDITVRGWAPNFYVLTKRLGE